MNYILKDKIPVLEEDLITWAKWLEQAALSGERTVAKDTVGKKLVSTVFLGIDHQYGAGPPILFETMILDDNMYDSYQERYETWEEAEAGHIIALAIAKGETSYD